MKFIFLLAIITSVYCGLTLKDHWHSFKLTHGKRYANLNEERYRRKVFMENHKMIEEHNKLYEEGVVSYRLKMNHFGDMRHEEFHKLMNTLNVSATSAEEPLLGNILFHQANPNETLPNSVDWRNSGMVTEVKDQGKCGACWSFSACGALEAQNFRKTGKLIPLSEQNLIDCTASYGNDGCHGGLMDNAYKYISDNRGVDTDSSYPYEASEESCRFDPSHVGATTTNFVLIPRGDEEALKHAVATMGPISAGVDGNHHSFQFYSGGIYYNENCTVHINHAVLIVGYGTDEEGTDYWLLKNSWNTLWGEKGYARLSRNKNNHCGVAVRPSYPLL